MHPYPRGGIRPVGCERQPREVLAGTETLSHRGRPARVDMAGHGESPSCQASGKQRAWSRPDPTRATAAPGQADRFVEEPRVGAAPRRAGRYGRRPRGAGTGRRGADPYEATSMDSVHDDLQPAVRASADGCEQDDDIACGSGNPDVEGVGKTGLERQPDDADVAAEAVEQRLRAVSRPSETQTTSACSPVDDPGEGLDGSEHLSEVGGMGSTIVVAEVVRGGRLGQDGRRPRRGRAEQSGHSCCRLASRAPRESRRYGSGSAAEVTQRAVVTEDRTGEGTREEPVAWVAVEVGGDGDEGAVLGKAATAQAVGPGERRSPRTSASLRPRPLRARPDRQSPCATRHPSSSAAAGGCSLATAARRTMR